MNVLLTDSDSLIASTLQKELESHGFTTHSPAPDDLNWLDPADVSAYFKQNRPKLLIDVSLYSAASVDTPSTEYRPRYEHLCRVCNDLKVPVIYLSSYRVFGEQWCEGGYAETAEPEPQDDYGQYLLDIETHYLSLNTAMVVRLSWLIDRQGNNLFTRILRDLQAGQAIALSDVIKGNPTSVGDVARTLLACVQQIFCDAENWGIFHLHTSDSCSEAEFADYLFRILGKQTGEVSGQLNVMSGATTSALASGCALLKGKRLTNNFGIKLRTWRQGIKALVEEWLSDAS